jgi:surfactin synthase thioesterase subunit
MDETPGTAKSTLVLLHHAGGSARIFDSLIPQLPAHITPFPFELPGRGRRWREGLLTRMDEAVEDLAGALRPVPGPFAIFGHSLGAYLGLALAHRLEERDDDRCATLFASAIAAPLRLPLPTERSPLLATDEEILAVATRNGGLFSLQVLDNPQLRMRTANLLRADLSLSYSFLQASRDTMTKADVVVCCGDQDVFPDSDLSDWHLSTTGETAVLRFPGRHFYLESQAAALADAIARHIRAGFRHGSHVR